MTEPSDFLPSPASLRPIRVATWNLHNCRRGLSHVADHISSLNADVVGLEEVDRGTQRSGGQDQAALLAAACGFAHHRFFRAIGRDNGEYGLGLLSRWPVSEPRVGMLPNAHGFEQRIFASVVIDFPPARLSFSVTHLSSTRTEPALRREQARYIVSQLRDVALPQVLVGDFNEGPGGAAHRELRAEFTDAFAARGNGSGGTFPLVFGLLPPLRLDYVYVSRSLGIAGARVAPSKASDHDALVAEVWLPTRRIAGLGLFEA